MLTVICLAVAVLLGHCSYIRQIWKTASRSRTEKNGGKICGHQCKPGGYHSVCLGRRPVRTFRNPVRRGLTEALQDMGTTYFLPSIAAAFVGGTVASGGKSNVAGVCLGALMMYLLTTFLNAASLSGRHAEIDPGSGTCTDIDCICSQ